MKLILSSSDFGNPESAKFIHNHLDKPIEEVKVLYFPNEKVTPAKLRSGMYEARLSAFGFQRKNIYVADYFNPTPYFGVNIDVIYISGGNTFGTMKLIREAGFDKAIVDYVNNGVVYTIIISLYSHFSFMMQQRNLFDSLYHPLRHHNFY